MKILGCCFLLCSNWLLVTLGYTYCCAAAVNYDQKMFKVGQTDPKHIFITFFLFDAVI